jgi:membrane associated rhomboid family serine protease
LEARLGGAATLQSFINRWAVIPVHIFSNLSAFGYTLITATFLHAGWLHIGSNMLFLYIFGDNVEDSLGHIKYLFFYLFVGALANFAQAYLSPHSAIPLLGASGAIAGVLGCYIFFYPHARVLTLIPILFFITIREIPAFFLLGVWFILQTVNGTLALSSELVTKQSVGGIAWWAHASGFVSGMLLAPALGKKKGKYR